MSRGRSQPDEANWWDGAVSSHPLTRHALAELVGTAFLVTAVIGSGIAAVRLSPSDLGLQLLENSVATRVRRIRDDIDGRVRRLLGELFSS
jgi:hypothetical protein